MVWNIARLGNLWNAVPEKMVILPTIICENVWFCRIRISGWRAMLPQGLAIISQHFFILHFSQHCREHRLRCLLVILIHQSSLQTHQSNSRTRYEGDIFSVIEVVTIYQYSIFISGYYWCWALVTLDFKCKSNMCTLIWIVISLNASSNLMENSNWNSTEYEYSLYLNSLPTSFFFFYPFVSSSPSLFLSCYYLFPFSIGQ